MPVTAPVIFFQDFMTTMDANDEKIRAVGMFGDQLCQDGHYAADKVIACTHMY